MVSCFHRSLPWSLENSGLFWVQDTARKTRVGLVQSPPPSPPIRDLIWVLPALEEKSCSQEISVWVSAWAWPFVCSSPLTESVTCPAWKLWGGEKDGCNCFGTRFSRWNNLSFYHSGGGLGGVNVITKIFVLKLVRTCPVGWSMGSYQGGILAILGGLVWFAER